MTTHSSVHAWRIPWTEEPGGLQSIRSQRVGHDWRDLACRSQVIYNILNKSFTFTFHFHALEKEMATHSSVLAWRIPGTGKPAGLPSMGSHRVGHDWRDLAAAAVIKAEKHQTRQEQSPDFVWFPHFLKCHSPASEWISFCRSSQDGRLSPFCLRFPLSRLSLSWHTLQRHQKTSARFCLLSSTLDQPFH